MTWTLPYVLPGGDVHVELVRDSRAGPRTVHFDDDRFTRPLLDGGWVDCDRSARRALLCTSHELTPGEFSHPYAGAVAAPFALWDGLDAFHGGAFCVGGRAVVVLGQRTAGKSTLLAHAAVSGLDVLTDDLAILFDQAGQVHVAAGPRCVDLREESAAWLAAEAVDEGRDVDIDVSQRDRRHRLRLAAAPASAPLAGFVLLGPGGELDVHRVPASTALGSLRSHRSLQVERPDHRSWFRTATAPVIELCRPHGLESVPAMLDVIRSEVASGWLAPG